MGNVIAFVSHTEQVTAVVDNVDNHTETITPRQYGAIIEQKARDEAGRYGACVPPAILHTSGALAVTAATYVREHPTLPAALQIRNIEDSIGSVVGDVLGEMTARRLLRHFVTEARGLGEALVPEELYEVANERGEA